MLAANMAMVPKLFGPAKKVAAKAIGTRFYTIMSPDPGYNNYTMGPYPKTKEERILAARKYNLIPEDYETYPEDEGFGDYPKLPEIGAANRDPYDDFDDPVDRRFYGEPFHLYYDLYQYERVDPMAKDKLMYPLWMSRLLFVFLAVSMPSYFWFMQHYNIHINQPWKQRRYWPMNHSPDNLRTRYAFPDSGSTHGGHH